EVWKETSVLRKRHRIWNSAGEQRCGVVDRIARCGDQADVAGIDDRDGQMTDAFLAADQREDLVRRIESHPKSTCHPCRGRLFELRIAGVIRIAMILRVVDGLGHPINDEFGRRPVGVADAEVDDVLAGGDGGALSAIYINEEIGRKLIESLGALES